ncbi:MAG: hypothetical protein BRC46_06895 [Cyanobacteria bacterium QS_6_48_18]|nr:MAG: hypothetical protein BRC45_05165 [Cyanobacteria bacterium QS_5_48_63]PSO93178.1 MAG: hypothetical protein BRC46_06895 [Cyanobacteria bacterium QS_6_48_18]
MENAHMSRVMPQAAETESLPIHAQVVSQTPGRLRFRFARPHRQPEKLEQIASALRKRLEISRVRTNVESGSMTVHYAQEHSGHDDIYVILQDLNVTFAAITEGQSVTTNGKSSTATAVTSAVTDWNRRVIRATNSLVDLRFLIPLGFSVLAVRQLLTKGLQLEFIPWYVLGWYAFDSFLKLHYTSDPHSENNKRLREG